MAKGLLFYSGKGIQDIRKTSGTGAAGSTDTYTIFYTDESVSAFSVRNGSNGLPGPAPDLSSYATKSQNETYYLGINAQANDSARFGGQLPSYYQTALGFTPYNASNPDGYITSASIPTSLPASDVYAWAKASTKPAYTWSEIGSIPTALSQFTNDLGNYGGFVTGTPWTGMGYLTGINSSMVTSAFGSQTANMVFASPNGSTGIPSFRYLTVNDIPSGVNAYIWNQYSQQNATINVSGNITTGGQFNGSGAGITGLISSQITTALGYTPLATRTFGTAANNNTGDFYATGSTVANSNLWRGYTNNFVLGYYDGAPMQILGFDSDGITNRFSPTAIKSFLGLGSSAYTNTNDHILNNNSFAQSANMWIDGSITATGVKLRGASSNGSTVIKLGTYVNSGLYGSYIATDFNYSSTLNTNLYFGVSNNGTQLDALILSSTGAATFASTIQSKDITISNGESRLNLVGTTFGKTYTLGSLADGSFRIYNGSTYPLEINSNNAATFASTVSATQLIISSSLDTSIKYQRTSCKQWGFQSDASGTYWSNLTDGLVAFSLLNNGSGIYASTVTATGFKTPSGTSSQLLTAAGGVINISSIGAVNENQYTYAGSSSGSIVCSQPFNGSTYKKVLIRVVNLIGSATFTYPTTFSGVPIVTAVSAGISLSTSYLYVTVTTSSSVNGWVVLEGY